MLLWLSVAFSSPQSDGWDNPDELLKRVTVQLERDFHGFNERGVWVSGDSGVYAWACSPRLRAMLGLYRLTKDFQWLERFVTAVSKMFATLSPDTDGFLSWRTRSYTGAYITVRPGEGMSPQSRLEPKDQWIYAPRVARRIRDARWRLTLQRRGKNWIASLWDMTTQRVIASLPFVPGRPFYLPPGIRLTVKGKPRHGDTFFVTTHRPKAFPFVVHDGVILTPICQFLLLVRDDPTLKHRYGEEARNYLRVIQDRIIPKWNRYWRDIDNRRGVFVFPDDPSFRFPGMTLPHNQYLALGRVFLLLYRLTDKMEYRRKAEKMGRFFKSCLRRIGNRYFWHYWDPAGPWDDPFQGRIKRRPEDTSHATLDIGFVLEAVESGLVFTLKDLKCFSATFLEVMWNGSLKEPVIGGWIDRPAPGRGSGALHEWVRLAKIEPLILKICLRVIPQGGSLLAKVQLLELMKDSGRSQRDLPVMGVKKGWEGK